MSLPHLSLSPQLPLFCAIVRLIKAEHTKPRRADTSQRKRLWTLGDRSKVHSLRKLSLSIQLFSQSHFYTSINIYPDSPACSQRADNPECVSQPLSTPLPGEYLSPLPHLEKPIRLGRPHSHTTLHVKLSNSSPPSPNKKHIIP